MSADYPSFLHQRNYEHLSRFDRDASSVVTRRYSGCRNGIPDPIELVFCNSAHSASWHTAHPPAFSNRKEGGDFLQMLIQ
ncbi:hypothetical protein RB195_025889 [Necator americanus]|uniref:Uncharacterized protein n=1 Tax=Necator americanus TaxID=51031 RepID=A0ABR1EUE9_NECAM